MCLIVLRFLAVTLTLETTSMCMHACGNESVECHKAARLFNQPFQRLFFTCKHNIVPSKDSKNACCRFGKLSLTQQLLTLQSLRTEFPARADFS